MFCYDSIHFNRIGKKPCAEDHWLNYKSTSTTLTTLLLVDFLQIGIRVITTPPIMVRAPDRYIPGSREPILSITIPRNTKSQTAWKVYKRRGTKLTTVVIRSFWTDMPEQTVQTQIRLLQEEQSDLGLHCLPFRLHRLHSLLYGRAT